MDRPSKAMLARMPLAEAVLLLWRWVTSEERMQSLWDQHRGRCYEKVISFSVMVHLIAQALLKHSGSGRRAFEQAIDDDELEASVQAAFKKLGRLPVSLSQAFLSQCTAALRDAFPEWAEWKLPKSLQGFRVITLDGKVFKRVAKRLKPLRGVPGGLSGGRALVALEWNTGLNVAMHAHEDGEANDVRFVGDLVPVVREQVEGPILWMGDSAFCDLTQPEHFTAEEGDHFLVRHHSKTPFFRDSKQKQRKGKDEKGRPYVETWGYLGSEHNKRRRYVRRIEVQREKAKPLVLITDLLDADAYRVEDLLWLYAERWGIEQVFQKVTEVFGLQRLIGGSPKACIFQFAFCLLLYNLLQVVRGYLAESHDIEPEDVSTKKLFEDVKDQLVAWNVMVDPPVTVRYLAATPKLPELRLRLAELMESTWRERWRLSPRQERHAKTKKKKARTHNSVYRILQADAQKSSTKRARSP